MVKNLSLGERITELRKQCGMTQNQLAKAMEVSRQAVSKWESGLSAPDSLKLIHLAEILDTDIEYLSTGRRNFARRPPVVINTVETVEKIVEKPVVQVVETIVEKVVEVPVVEYVEKPVVKKVYRTRILRSPLEFAICGILCFALGIAVGLLF